MIYSFRPINNDTGIVTVGEYLDFRNATVFKSLLKDQICLGIRNFILDFSGTNSFDSTGIGSIFTIYKQLVPFRGTICFASRSRTVENTVQLTQLYKIIPQFQSVEAAREDLETRSACSSAP